MKHDKKHDKKQGKKHGKKDAVKKRAVKTAHKTELSRSVGRSLVRTPHNFTVASLEKALLAEFPKADAEAWDVMGLTVGERALSVGTVAVSLDPTVLTIRKAAELGADVLITHHPPYLEGPCTFAPEESVALSPGAGVWAAITHQVALMNFHTALDVSKRAQGALPNLLGFSYDGRLLETIDDAGKKGYGQICTVPVVDGASDTLGRVAAKCVSVFGKTSQVWGDFSQKVRTCATVLGSSKNVAHKALEAHVDCLICGEIGYHDALALSQAGLGIIELGHDVSELPLVAVLAKTLADIGVPVEDIVMIDQSDNWNVPETIRL